MYRFYNVPIFCVGLRINRYRYRYKYKNRYRQNRYQAFLNPPDPEGNNGETFGFKCSILVSFNSLAKKDTDCGLTSPYYVISHDQVPLKIADSNGVTVHTTGCDEVYDAIGKDADITFCTLNLYGSMWNREDGLNIPMPNLVFEGDFCPGSEWHDQEEKLLWDPRVVLLFQPNAWVDAQTHMFGLKMIDCCFI